MISKIPVALLGGSFNPPHLAHQMICLWLLSTKPLTQVWLLPCHVHPFGKDLVDFDHRVAMCKLLATPFAGDRIVVSSVERELPKPNRTVNTLRHLVEHHPTLEFSLVVGADILEEKEKWFQFSSIEKLAAQIIVVDRAGYPHSNNTFLPPDISSTHVRELLASKGSVENLLPNDVFHYIKKNGLYGCMA